MPRQLRGSYLEYNVALLQSTLLRCHAVPHNLLDVYLLSQHQAIFWNHRSTTHHLGITICINSVYSKPALKLMVHCLKKNYRREKIEGSVPKIYGPNLGSHIAFMFCPFGNLDFHQFCSHYLENFYFYFYFYICHDKIWCNLKNNRQNSIMFSVVQS